MFFISWEMQYNENSHSYGQLVIGSFITTTCPLMNQVSCRVFWWNFKSPRWLSPLTAQTWYPATSGFYQTKITFEREDVSVYWWDSGKYDEAANGDSNKGFRRVFWTVEQMVGELCEVPRFLLWKGLRCHCTMFLVSGIFFKKVSIFHSTWLDTFWTELVYINDYHNHAK